MSDVIDLKAKRLEKAQSLADEFLIENDNSEVSMAMVPLIEALQKLAEALNYFLHEYPTVEVAEEFLNHSTVMFSSALDAMVAQVEDASGRPFHFYEDGIDPGLIPDYRDQFAFDHGPDLVETFIEQTRRENGTFDLQKAMSFSCELRDYHVLVMKQISELIDELGPTDPLTVFKEFT